MHVTALDYTIINDKLTDSVDPRLATVFLYGEWSATTIPKATESRSMKAFISIILSTLFLGCAGGQNSGDTTSNRAAKIAGEGNQSSISEKPVKIRIRPRRRVDPSLHRHHHLTPCGHSRTYIGQTDGDYHGWSRARRPTEMPPLQPAILKST